MEKVIPKRILAWVLTFAMVSSMFPVTAFAEEPSKSAECIHSHDEFCGYVAAVEEVPCDKECTDTDGDGLIDHVEGCAYTPPVEGQPCTHVHDESCGEVIVEQSEKDIEAESPTEEDTSDREESLRELIALLNELPDPMACLAQESILDQDQLAKARAAVDDWFAGEAAASSGSEEEREQLQSLILRLEGLEHIRDTKEDCLDVDCPYHYPEIIQQQMAQDETPELLTLDDLVEDYGVEPPMQTFGRLRSASVPHPQTLMLTEDNENNSHTGSSDGDIDKILSKSDGNHPIEMSFTLNEVPTQSAYLAVKAYDVDEDSGETDYVYINDDIFLPKDKMNSYKQVYNDSTIGYLSGTNATWNTTILRIPLEKLKVGKNTISVTIASGWVVKVDWMQLVLDGGAADKNIEEFSLKLENSATSGNNVTVQSSVTVRQTGNVEYTTEYTLTQNATGNALDACFGTVSASETIELALPLSSPSGIYTITGILKESATEAIKATDSISFYFTQNQGLGPKISHTLTPDSLTNQNVTITVSAETVPEAGITDVSISESSKTVSANGSYSFTVNYTLNGSSQSVTYPVKVDNIDKVKPTITYSTISVFQDEEYETVKKMFADTLSVSDNGTLAGEPLSYTIPQDISNTPGTKTITVTAKDAAGNTTTQNCTITVMAKPVKLTMGTPAPVSGSKDSYTLNAVLSNGSDQITETGFVWGVMPNPTLALNNGSVTTASVVKATGETLTGTATGLLSGVEYYARAYAKVTENGNTNVVYSEAGKFGFGIPSYGTFSVSSVSGSTFTITRTGGTDGAQTVYYRTVNGSAIGGTHFTHQAGTLTFADGETSKTVTVAELGVTSAYNNDAGTKYSNADRTYALEIYRVEGGGAIDQNIRSKTRTMAKNSSYTVDRSVYTTEKSKTQVAAVTGTSGQKVADTTSNQGGRDYTNVRFLTNRYGNKNYNTSSNFSTYYTDTDQAAYLNATATGWYYRYVLRAYEHEDGYEHAYIGTSPLEDIHYDISKGAGYPVSGLAGQLWSCTFLQGQKDQVGTYYFPDTRTGGGENNYYPKNSSGSYVSYNNQTYVSLGLTNTAYCYFGANGSNTDIWYVDGLTSYALVKDDQEPALLGIAPMAGGTYLVGDSITVALVFDEIVDSTNSSLGSVSINTNVGTLTYAGGADTNVLYFTGTVSSTVNLNGSGALKVTGINNSSYIKDMCSTAGTTSTPTSGSSNVIVDATKPTVTITVNTSGSLPQHKATITATDANTLQYAWTKETTLPVSGWSNVASGTQLTESRGTAGATETWYLHVLATSPAGATTHQYRSFSFMQPNITAVSVRAGTLSTSADVADVWKPSKYIVVTYAGATSGTTLTFAGPETSSQTITAASGTNYLQVTKNGTYTVTLTDGYGNVISKTIEVKKIDADKPTVTLRSGNSTDGNTVYNSLSIAVLPEDAGGSGLAKVEYVWTNTATAPTSWSQLTAASDGSYQATYTATETTKTAKYLHVKVTDGAGNVSSVVTSGPYQVIKPATGTALPSITVTGNPTAWTNSAALTWFVTKGNANIKTVYTPDGAVNGTTLNGSCTVTKNGAYTFVVIDANGNSASAEVNVTWVDSEAPKLTSLTAQAGHTNGTITLAGVTDNCTVIWGNNGNISSYSGSGLKTRQYKLESASTWTTFTGDRITVSKNGTYIIKLTDQVGNSREYRVKMDGIDATAPNVTYALDDTANASSGWYTTANLPVVLTFADEAGTEGGTPSGIQSVQYQWVTSNATKPTSGLTNVASIASGTVTTTLSNNGTWYLYYKVTDKKGNVTEGFSDVIKKDTFSASCGITGPTTGQPISSGLAMKCQVTYGPSGGRITGGTDAASATLLDTFDQSTGTVSRTKTVDYTAKSTGENNFRFYQYAANGEAGTSSCKSWPFYVRQITFNSQGGSNVEAQLVWHKSQTSTELVCAVTKPSDPTRTGYTFGGWYKDAACTDGKQFDFDTQVKEDTTLYAKWTAAADTSYKVNHYTEDLTGGTWTLQGTDNKTGTTGDSLTLADLAKSITGFTYKEGKAGGSVVTSTTILADGSSVIDLYYTRNTYTLTLNQGTGISGVTGGGSYKYGQSVSVNATVSAGYTWENWTGTNTSTKQEYSFTMPASNVTLTANATINRYTVTFNANGHGTAPGSQTVNYGGKADEPAALTATGYVFGGWYTDEACTDGNEFNFESTQVIENTILYAKWTAATNTLYKVNHYTEDLTGGTWTLQGTDNKTGTTGTALTLSGLAKSITGFTYKEGKAGGSVVTSTTILADGSSVIELYYTRNDYTLTLNKGTGIFSVTGGGSYKYEQSVSVNATVSAGYTWKDWTGDKTSNNQKFSFTMPASDVTMTANATINQYTVTFNANGHGTAPDSQTVSHGGKADEPAALTATGYVFGGWYTDEACTDGNEFNFESTQVIENTILYAKWTAATNTLYKVNHYTEDLTGGTWTLQGTDSKTGTTGDSLTLANLAKSIPGFTYKEGKAGGSVVTSTTILADGSRVIDLYYTRNAYTLTLNQGTGISGVSGGGSYKYGQSVSVNATVSAGYTWKDWTGDKTSNNQKFSFTMPASNVTITANATINQYAVTFDANGHGTAPDSQTVSHGGKAAQPAALTATGYVFGGWYTDAACTDGKQFDFANTQVKANITLYAKWTAAAGTSYKVNHYTEDLTGGTWTLQGTDNKTGTTGTALTLSGLAKSMTGFTYKEGKAGDSVVTSTTILADGSREIELYYTRNAYTLTLNQGTGISGVTGGGSYKYGQSVSVNATVSAGYTWKNWTGDQTSTKQEFSFTMPASDVTLTANATINQYTVTFNANGHGTAPGSQTVSHGGKADEPAALTATGYVFGGWYTDAACTDGKLFDFGTQVKADTTLYAKWTAAAGTSYRVNHYIEDLTGGTWTLQGTDDKTGTTGAALTLANLAKSIPGFTYKEGKAGGSVVTSTTILADGSRVIDLYYTRNDYTLTLNQGTGISGVTGGGSYKYGQSVSADATVSAGYTWENWTGDQTSTDQEFSFTMPASNVTITANATINRYTVTFNANGHGTAPGSQTVNYGGKADEPAALTATGYVFGGWYQEAGCINKWDFSANTVTSSITLYAKWTAATNTLYKVNHYTENLTGGTWTRQGTDSKTGTTGAALTLADLAKSISGFTYKEGKAGGSVVTSTTILADGSRVIELYYTRNAYTLTLNQGTGISDVSGGGSYKYEQSVSVNATVSAGYTWKDWTGTNTSTKQEYSFTMPASNVTMTANATINRYTVTFNANGHGTAPGSQTVNYGGKAVQPAALTATGYVFGGWYTDAACTDGKQFDFAHTQVKADTTLYAKWTAADTAYKVNHYTENLTGGTWTRQSTDSKTGTTGAALTLADLAKSIPGFTYKEGKAGGSVVTSTTILADGSRVINLYYTRNTYTLTLNQGTGISGVSGGGSYKYGQSVSVNATVSAGYTWKDWTGDQTYTKQEFSFTMPASDVTITANATINRYTVTFNANGHGTAPGSQTVNYGGKAVQPAALTATGYGFGGWYTDAACTDGKLFDFGTQVKADITLYAKWTLTKPSVTLTADGGTTNSGVVNAVYKNGATVITLKAELSNRADSVAGIHYTYAWYKGGVQLDSTDESLILKTVDQSGSYKVEVTAHGAGQTATKASVEITVSIAKATPEVTVKPTASDITYGNSLSRSSLTGGEAKVEGTTVAGSFAWAAPGSTPAVSDSNATPYTVVFTPEDTANYRSVTTTLTPKVNKKPITAVWIKLTAEYNGTAQAPECSTLVGLMEADAEDVSADFIAEQRLTNAGTKRLTAVLGGERADNYRLTNPDVNFTVQKAPVTFAVADNTVPADGHAHKATVSAYANGAAFDASKYTITYRNATGQAVEEPADAGTYGIYAELINPNYRHSGTADGTACQIGVLTIYRNQTAKTYTVEYAKGASEVTGDLPASQTGVSEGTLIYMPEKGNLARTGYSFTGWLLNGKLYQPGETFTMPRKNVTITACWKEATYRISGEVDQEGNRLQHAVVMLKRGSEIIGETTTDADGKYSFEGVIPGLYNLVTSYNGIITTVKVLIVDADAEQNATLPAGRTNSILEVVAGAPAVIVGNLEKLFQTAEDSPVYSQIYTENDKAEVETGGTVEIRLTVEKVAEPDQTGAELLKEAMQKLPEAFDYQSELYLDLILQKTIYPAEGSGSNAPQTETLSDSQVILESVISLPSNLQNRKFYKVYRIHQNAPGDIVLEELTTQTNAEGEYYELNPDNTELTIHARKYSVYTVAASDYVEPQPEKPESSGGTEGHPDIGSLEEDKKVENGQVNEKPLEEEKKLPEESDAETERTGEIPEEIPEELPEEIPEELPEEIPEEIPEAIPEAIPEELPEAIPEDTLPEQEQREEPIPAGRNGKSFVVLNILLTLLSLVMAVLLLLGRQERRRKIVGVTAAAASLLILLLTLGFAGVRIADLRTILFALLAAITVFMNLTGSKQDKEERVL